MAWRYTMITTPRALDLTCAPPDINAARTASIGIGHMPGTPDFALHWTVSSQFNLVLSLDGHDVLLPPPVEIKHNSRWCQDTCCRRELRHGEKRRGA